jgi:cyclic dehypoxanthinyl futalosine synthase
MESARSTIERVAAGARLDPDAALHVMEHAATDDLARGATAVRDRFSDPHVVTYLVDRNVNYTNVCITDCKFCEFYRPPGHRDAYVLTRDVLARKLAELRDAGGTRVLLQGGHHPDLRLGWYEDTFRWMREAFPMLELDALSPPEIEHIALVENLPIRDVMVRLLDAGLGGVPGGGGEILDDEIRHIVSPKKTKTQVWLSVMEIAHELDLYTSASMVFGFGEEPRHRINSLLAIRDQQDRSLARFGRGFMAFVTWPLLHESRYGHVFGALKGWKLGGTPEEYLRHVAFCRLFLDNVEHFQVSWPTLGLDVAARALRAGCDDMGGTMMEENVVSQAGSVHCSVSEAEVRGAIEEAGFVPQKRDSRYRPLTAAAAADVDT